MEILQSITEQEKLDARQEPTAEEQNIINYLDWFKSKKNGSYATYDDAEKLIKSNRNPEVWLQIKNDLETRAKKDYDSKYTEGINIDLAKETIFDVRKKVAQDDIELAKTLNRTGIIENYDTVNKYLDTDDMFKIEGINPEEGAPAEARVSMSFAGMGGDNEKAIKNAIIYSLPGDQQDKYYSLNYKGPDVHVQLKQFADGKKRAIYKVPTELGGDNQYRLFNEPGEWKKDVAGFSAEIPILLADLAVGYATAGAGPNAVALSTGATNAVGEFLKLKIGQDFYNQNQDMDFGDMTQQALVMGGITGGATRLMFPLFNVANRIYGNLKSKIGVGEGALSRKVIKDFVQSYKEGAGKDIDTDQLYKEMKQQLMKPVDKGGLGYDEKRAAEYLKGKKNLAITDPSTIAGQSAKEIMTSPAGKNQPFGSRIKTEAFDEAKKITEKNLEMQKQIISDITGIDVTKLSQLNMASDAYRAVTNIANERYRSNLIRQADFTEKFQKDWSNYSKKYIGALQPEQQNFNQVFIDIVGPMKTTNYARANNLNSELNEILGKVTVTFPKSNIKQASPSKVMKDAINETIKFEKYLKNNNLLDEATQASFKKSKDVLKLLQNEFNTTKKMSALAVMEGLENIDRLKTFYPELSPKLTALQSSLRNAMNKSKAVADRTGTNIFNKQYQFIENNRITKDGVIGEMINKLGGTTGPVVKFKTIINDDLFDTLFGNKQSQLQALKYLKTGLNGGLSKDKSDTLKTMMHNKFIGFIENGGTVKEFNKKYLNSYKQIFSPKEMKDFINVQKSRSALEKIISTQYSTSQKAKNVFPSLRNLDIQQMNYYTISQALLDPTNTPKQVKTFFNSISKEAGEEPVKSIKSHYLKSIFDQFKTQDPILMRDTLDGAKFFNWFKDVKNEQVFINMFGESQAKNMKVIAAQLNLMQNFKNYVSENLSEKAANKMRETATRMVYGPLSHENVLIKGAIFFLNQFDQKLGKELFDYDYFIERFKNSYAAEYAPALNDKKYLKYFNSYDAGTKQRLYTSTLSGLGFGAKEEQKGSTLSDTGLPSFDFIDTISLVKNVAGEPIAKNLNSAVDIIVGNVEKANEDERKKKTLEKIRQLEK